MKKLKTYIPFRTLGPVLALYAISVSPGIRAENIDVTGLVSDAYGRPLSGVLVAVEGDSCSVLTDKDGRYSICGVPAGATLVCTRGGMEPARAAVGGRPEINVIMRDDARELGEIVKIGYGTAKLRDLTIPVGVVKAEDFTSVPSASAMYGVQGKVAGVYISGSGMPGESPKVVIRGMSSFFYNSPLYVVDGVSCDDISFLSQSDIQDVTILKDASSCAIYGVRGANGVVIITTKRGR